MLDIFQGWEFTIFIDILYCLRGVFMFCYRWIIFISFYVFNIVNIQRFKLGDLNFNLKDMCINFVDLNCENYFKWR